MEKTRYGFRPLAILRGFKFFYREMNQLFDRFFGTELIEGPWGKISYPPMRVAETKNEIIVFLHPPPLSPDENRGYI